MSLDLHKQIVRAAFEQPEYTSRESSQACFGRSASNIIEPSSSGDLPGYPMRLVQRIPANPVIAERANVQIPLMLFHGSDLPEV